jgi:hypothetical protein
VGAWRKQILLVDPQQLLVLRDDPRLGDGRPGRIDNDARVQAGTLKESMEVFAGRVGATDPDQCRRGVKPNQVGSDIAGAAKGLGAPPDVKHRDRGLGRNALDVAPEVLVEHKIAQHEDARALETFESSSVGLLAHLIQSRSPKLTAEVAKDAENHI